ncbi:MAG: 2-hydroxyacid dehydrogenase [Minwuiales bacterium]|nr:2-hydroxyacid dehydrogenase [Minwuiales bacterium]
MTEELTVLVSGTLATGQGARLADRLTTPWRQLTWVPDDGREKWVEAMARADAMISGAFPEPPPAAPNLKLFQIPFAGYDWLDRSLLPKDCTVCNTFEHEIPIAEFILLSMLEWEIGLSKAALDFKAGSWRYHGLSGGPFHGELFGKTVGLIGYGHIGEEVARRAAAFGMRTVAVARTERVAPPPLDWLGGADRDLDRLLAESDYVVVACVLSEETRGLIDAARLARMKPDAVLINVARGAVADQADLFRALQDRSIGGAVLDVWYNYPTAEDRSPSPADHPFHELDNVVMAPHISAWTTQMVERRWDFVAANLDRFARGEPVLNAIDFGD